MLADDSSLSQGLATLVGIFPVFIEDLPLHTWGSNQSAHSNGSSRPSFKVDWFPPVLNIKIVKTFRQLINYCFDRGQRKTLFKSCRPSKRGKKTKSVGTVKGKSYLRAGIKYKSRNRAQTIVPFTILKPGGCIPDPWKIVPLVYGGNLLSHP